MSLSNNKIKYIQSLKNKKHRNQHKTFVAEGEKLVLDLLPSLKCQLIAGLPEIIDNMPATDDTEIISATEAELKKASFLTTPPKVLAVFHQPLHKIDYNSIDKELNLVLDGVQDPGNLGTIVRLADWFGIEHLFCSHDCADIYNPKTTQATMGAIARIKVIYTDIVSLLQRYPEAPIYGTFLDGQNIYEKELHNRGFIVMGSEGNGISKEVENMVNERLLIPNYPKNRPTSESLNVAIATAITCSEFRRAKQ
ncbi:MAG: RNA methyltransferase [Fermentimonas sp.]|jgi:TrmH family RNA methyltransferase